MHTNHGPGNLSYVPTYRILSSKCPSPCKRPPPLLDDSMTLYIQMACMCKHPPQFMARQVPISAYSKEYGTAIAKGAHIAPYGAQYRAHSR